MAEGSADCTKGDSLSAESNCLSLADLNKLAKQSPSEVLHFIRNRRSDFIYLLNKNDTEEDLMCFAIIALGLTCSSDRNLHKDLNELMITLSSNMPNIAINIQRCLLSFQRKKVLEKYHVDALGSLIVFLKTFQTILPSSSFESISILLPLLVSTCNKCLKSHEEIHREVSEKLNEIEEEQKLFFEQHTNFEIKRKSEMEKLHLQEPPENFRSLSILPTVDDIDLPCSFLRPNITTGKYKDTEHYLDVQFRLLKEDYIKPLRDGITEYLSIIRNKQSLKKCKNVRVYSNAFIESEEFVNGDLLHVIKFREKYFSEIKWENSKRFLTGNLLCLSTDNYRSMLFATVIRREPEKLKKGLLTIKFEEMSSAVLTLNPSINFVVIETSAMFESYRHNLNVLQLLNEETLAMKKYIVGVEKTVNKPKYLKPTTTYEMTPLLLPLQEKNVFAILECPKHVRDRCKSVTVTDDSSWPTAAMLNLDESQYTALKTAITKEFAIIQGPPGTGKTFVGLRTVQLLLHNIDSWFHDKLNSLPILIVCYTNHALDQFLEGISLFTSKIVRIGGGRVSETIDKFRIKSLVISSRRDMPETVSSKIWTAKDKIIELKKQINTITDFMEYSTQHILDEYTLKDYIPSSQFKSLRMVYMVDDDGYPVTYTIYDWLEMRTHDESLPELKSDPNEVLMRNSFRTNEEVENEGEGDIEFIESQRNIDFYDFDDAHVLRRGSIFNEASDKEFKYQRKSNKKIIDKLIRDGLTKNSTMKSHRALRIKNVWMLRIHERWQLYKFWLERFIEGKRIEYENLQEELKIAFKNQTDARIAEELHVIKSALVVGMTTTGAAKYRHIIDARNPVVLIVEEAAEILESHIITSLAEKTQHVVLIGDQQQLRPSPTVHMLGVKYGMNVSLFERLIKNGMDYCRLSVQHRMRPEIAALICPHIYPNLENHKAVAGFEKIKGVSKNVFFVTHNFDESFVHDSKSKVNAHEARFIVQLCQYLIFQGYETSQITVLTTYSGQLSSLKKLATGVLEEVRFTVVDNYQGEENDIILISFVRSNMEGEVGFLKVSNRINVALSRAKKGLYCIGNFELLAQKSKLWKDILETLAKNKSVGPSLCLTCQNHPDVLNEVMSDTDFAKVPDGGCIRKCEYRLQCGHRCILSCHPYDRSHVSFQCEKPCTNTCKEGHLCPKQCFEDCGSCEILVNKILPCDHPVITPCGKDELEIECQNACRNTCKESHPCLNKCFEDCGNCETLVDKTFTECGHTMKVPCWKSKTTKCESICIKTCERGHPCHRRCGEVCGSCYVLVEKTLSCGHTVGARCYNGEHSIKCTLQCSKVLSCLHQCINKCSEPCVNECSQLTKIQSPVCGHFLKIECRFKSCLERLSQKCSEPCRELLPCGHRCKGTCSRCHQGRLHVSCKEICKRILICGHKCEYQCFQNCPPCEKSCANRCIHRKCFRICSSSCVKCIKPCAWRCSHKKCNRLCHEVCDRDPCNEPCSKTLRCKHPCMGFCGEPCPRKCSICENKRQKKCEDSEDDETDRYIYLEDCKHIFKERDLSTWMTAKPEEMQEIRMKVCPKCKTVIRTNVRFGKIIKHCLAEIEKVKDITRWNKEKNLKIQRGLLEQVNTSLSNFNVLYKPIIKVLSSAYVRNINELSNIANIINVAGEIELKSYGINLSLFETVVDYTRCCREWLGDFLRSNFLTVSEFQLVQLLREIHRLRLLDLVLKFAKEKHFTSLSTEFEKCTTHLANFKIFNDDGIECFRTAFKNLTESFSNDCWDLPAQNFVLNDVSMSGNWYQCSKEHTTCIVDCSWVNRKICYECDENIDKHPIITKLDTNPTCLTDSTASNRSNLEHTTRKQIEFLEKGFAQDARFKASCGDKSVSTHSISASVSGRYTTSLSKNRSLDERPNMSSRSFQSKDLNMKNIYDRKNCYGAVQKNITRNRNEEHSANRLDIPLTVDKHVSGIAHGQNKRPTSTYKFFKRFQESSMKMKNETTERTQPEGCNAFENKPLLSDYSQRTRGSLPTLQRDPFRVSRSTPLFRNRPPSKFNPTGDSKM